MIKGVFDDFILKLLCAAAVVATIIGMINEGPKYGWIEGCSILIAIIIITVVTVSQDYSKEKQFQAMMELDDIKSAFVIRNGHQKEVDTQELVVGDLIFIRTGDYIPADCIIVKSNQFSADEASLTGEPDAKRKETLTMENFGSDPCPLLFQGTLCSTGTAYAVVLAVGNNTAQGKAGLSMNMEDEQTPLQKKLDTIANQIGKMGMCVAILTFIAIVIRILCVIFVAHDREFLDR